MFINQCIVGLGANISIMISFCMQSTWVLFVIADIIIKCIKTFTALKYTTSTDGLKKQTLSIVVPFPSRHLHLDVCCKAVCKTNAHDLHQSQANCNPTNYNHVLLEKLLHCFYAASGVNNSIPIGLSV